MKLSVPIYRLKRDAKKLACEANIPLHTALDRIAQQEGFARWSLLAAKHAQTGPASRLLPQLIPGSMTLIGARPGQGKTLLGLELAMGAVRQERPAWIFTLEETERSVAARLRDLGLNVAAQTALLRLDCSDRISAAHIIKRLQEAPRGALILIDYLQLLDQRRDTPPLAEQVQSLKAYAEERGLIVVCLSQIDRSYDPSLKPYPDMRDVRLPNPLDLSLFDKACFLNDGEVQLSVSR